MSDKQANAKTSTGMLIDGVFASEAIDSSGEILDIKGLDITDFEEGKGNFNYEHQGHDDKDANGKSKNQGQEIVGKIVYAKKIYEAKDCTNEREKMFWDKVKLPFLYGVGRLYDGAGHDGAKALAAIIRDSVANEEPLVVGFSIEGSTLDKDAKTNRLKSTLARRVAITLRPCNKTAIADLLADPNAPDGYPTASATTDLIAMVSSPQQAKKSEIQDPLYTRLGGSEAVYGVGIFKALSAGNYNVSPGSLTGGAALQVSELSTKKKNDPKEVMARVVKAYADWNRKDNFREYLTKQMEDVSPEFLEHYIDTVERNIFKIRKAQEVISDLAKAGKKPAKIQKTPPPVAPVEPQPAGDPLMLSRMSMTDKAHKLVMRDWLPLNDNFTKNNVSPGILDHAAAFASLAPGVNHAAPTDLHSLEASLKGLEAPAEGGVHPDAIRQSLQHSGGDAQALARHLSSTQKIRPNLARYISAILGGGDITIPEKRFVNHFYGSKDASIKNTHGELSKFDRGYFSHPAVQAVLSDPALGNYFKGKEPQALMAGYLKHHDVIPGIHTGQNELWDGANLAKSGDFNPDLPKETAKQHQRWVELYGPGHAFKLYVKNLVPKLIENDAKRSESLVQKFESLQVEFMAGLRKAADGATAPLEAPSTVVDMAKHGVGQFNKHPNSHALGHGFDFNAPREEATKGLQKKTSFWSHTPAGQKVYVKGEYPTLARDTFSKISQPRLEGIYTNMARDYFGMGGYVPDVSVVKHPTDGVEHAIIKHVPGEEFNEKDPEHHAALRKMRDSGELDKIYLMDNIMGNWDRKSDNYLMTKEGGMKLIDHGLALENEDKKFPGIFSPWGTLQRNGGNPWQEPVHPEAQKWLQSLDVKTFEDNLRAHEVPDRVVEAHSKLLRELQKIQKADSHLTRKTFMSRARSRAYGQNHFW
jgi:hypothetical protein